MKDLAPVLFCDTYTVESEKDDGTKVTSTKLAFNSGRMVGGLMTLAVGFVVGVWVF
jgi:hypothetical protein